MNFGYFDSSFKDGQAGLASLICEENGDNYIDSTKIVASSSEESEMLALDLLVNLAIKNNIKQLTAQGDCKAVIRLLNRNKTKSRLKFLHQQIKSLEIQFDNIAYNWIPRQHNRQADRIAKEALK